MRKLLLYFFIAGLYCSPLQAEILKKLEVIGNKRVSNETIKLYGGIDLNKDYQEQEINKILNNLYSTNFFKNVEINFSNNTLIVKVIEYPVINNLVILGEPSKKYKEKIIELINSKNKDSFIRSKLAADVEIIKKLYASSGYNSAKVNTKIREKGF